MSEQSAIVSVIGAMDQLLKGIEADDEKSILAARRLLRYIADEGGKLELYTAFEGGLARLPEYILHVLKRG